MSCCDQNYRDKWYSNPHSLLTRQDAVHSTTVTVLILRSSYVKRSTGSVPSANLEGSLQPYGNKSVIHIPLLHFISGSSPGWRESFDGNETPTFLKWFFPKHLQSPGSYQSIVEQRSSDLLLALFRIRSPVFLPVLFV